MVNEATQKKVHILKKSELPSIRNYIDEEALPVEYGGTLLFGEGEYESSRFNHPMELEVARYIDNLNDTIQHGGREGKSMDDEELHEADHDIGHDTEETKASEDPRIAHKEGYNSFHTPQAKRSNPEVSSKHLKSA